VFPRETKNCHPEQASFAQRARLERGSNCCPH
jgi:hypothetical protein